MLSGLFMEARKIGLKPDYGKTKVITSRKAISIQIDGNKLEYVGTTKAVQRKIA